MFVFHNGFWLNLHQFVRAEAFRRATRAAPELDPAALSEQDRGAWLSALETYGDLAKRVLVFDPTLVRMANALSVIGEDSNLAPGVVEPAFTAALNVAAPIYRTRIWSERRQANDEWIGRAKSLAARHEAVLAAALAAAYRASWPGDPILVDAVGDAGPNDAYTHDGPAGYGAHTLFSSSNSRNFGDASLELLFHEASHSDAIEEPLRRMIKEECARQKLAEPENLWHALIFFTTGVMTSRVLAQAGNGDYVAYGDRQAVYARTMAADRAALGRDWQPYLEGKVPFEQALHDLVRDAR